MSIVYFTETLPPYVDGVSSTLGRLFGELTERGRHFAVIAPFATDSSCSWADRVHVVPSITFPLNPNYRVSLPVSRRLTRLIEDLEPELLHVVSPTPMAVWAQSFAAQRGIPVVASYHTDFVSYFRYYGLAALEGRGRAYLRWFYNGCDAVLAPCEPVAAKLRRHGVSRVGIWSRGVDTERFTPLARSPEIRARVGASDCEPLLLFVSRLVREKDLSDLVAADALLREGGAPYRLAIVGDGPMRRHLELALPDATFTGELRGAELATWYASADVFVFPSTTETFGNVVLEALSAGLPCIVTDRGGPASLVDHGSTGFIVPGNDAAALAAATAELLADPSRRASMGRRARAAAELRDWNAVHENLLRTYDQIRMTRRASSPERAA